MGFLDARMKDGSRHCASFARSIEGARLRDLLADAEDVRVTDYVSDGVTEVWIDFVYRGHVFTLHDPFGEYWLFAKSPETPDPLLEQVTALLSRLLGARLGP